MVEGIYAVAEGAVSVLCRRKMCLYEGVRVRVRGVCTREAHAFCKRVRLFTVDPSGHTNKLPAPEQVPEAPCASVSPAVQWWGYYLKGGGENH